MTGNVKSTIKSLMLLELLKGMKLTGKYLFKTKFTVQYPTIAALSRAARAASLPQW